MKIELNIQKKHLYWLTAIIAVLFGSILVLAAANQAAKIHHETLAVDTITGYGLDTTTINNNVKINGDLDVTGTITGSLAWNQITSKPALPTVPRWSFCTAAPYTATSHCFAFDGSTLTEMAQAVGSVCMARGDNFYIGTVTSPAADTYECTYKTFDSQKFPTQSATTKEFYFW